MGLKEQIMDDVKLAMKAKQMDKLTALRGIHAEIKNKEISIRPEVITEEEVLELLKKLSKQRKDSIEQFKSAGREDLIQKEEFELALIEGYLPEPMSKDLLEKIVKEVIKETGATDMKQMGQVMKVVLAKTKGQADNKLVSELVKLNLN